MPIHTFLKARPGPVLEPISDVDAEVLEGLMTGEIVRADLFKPRNTGNHRRFFAMLQLAHSFESIQCAYPRLEPFRKALLIAAGYVTWVPGYDPRTGAPVELIIPQSMSFAAMDETEFRALFSHCIDALLRYFLVDQPRETLEKQFWQILEFV